MIKRGHTKDCPGCTSRPGDGARRLYHHEELPGGPFRRLPPERLEELLRIGARDATELNERLREQFTLDATARNLVLR